MVKVKVEKLLLFCGLGSARRERETCVVPCQDDALSVSLFSSDLSTVYNVDTLYLDEEYVCLLTLSSLCIYEYSYIFISLKAVAAGGCCYKYTT